MLTDNLHLTVKMDDCILSGVIRSEPERIRRRNDKYKDGDVVRFHIEDLKDDVELRNNLDYSTVAAIVL